MVMGEVSGGALRMCSPCGQEGALKAGWLRKQRSIMKNWQLRWFVLRADLLYFYKDQEETKAQVDNRQRDTHTHITPTHTHTHNLHTHTLHTHTHTHTRITYTLTHT